MNGQTCGPEGMAFGLRGSCAIGVMAKSPRPGHSKTRLCPPLRPEQAAQLSAAFLRDTTESIAAAALCAPIVGYAAYAPSGTEEALVPHLASGTSCVLADGSHANPSGRGRIRPLPPSCNPATVRGGPRRRLRPEFRYPDPPDRHPGHRRHGSSRWRRTARGAGSLRRWGLLPPRDAPPPCPAVRRHRMEHQLRRRDHAHPGCRAWSRSR